MALKPTAYPGVVISYGEQDLMWLANVSEDIRMLESNSHAKSLLKSFDGLDPKVKHAHSDAVVIIERPATNEFNMPGFSKVRVDRQSGVVYQSLPEKRSTANGARGIVGC